MDRKLGLFESWLAAGWLFYVVPLLPAARKKLVLREYHTIYAPPAYVVTFARLYNYEAAVHQGRDSPIFLQFFYLFSIFFQNRF
jgi:hypothetical protein